MKEGCLCALIYCLYVIGAKVEFSIGWLFFWLFFPIIMTLCIILFLILVGCLIALYLKFKYSNDKCVEKTEKNTNWIDECINNKELNDLMKWINKFGDKDEIFTDIKDKTVKKNHKKHKKS